VNKRTPLIRHSYFLIVFLLQVAVTAIAQDPAQPPAPNADTKMEIEAWHITSTLAHEYEATGRQKKSNLPPDARPIDKSDTDRIDLRDFFKSVDITFPPGSEAFYEVSKHTLIVRNTPKNLECVDSVVSPSTCGDQCLLKCELSTFEFSQPESANAIPPKALDIAALDKLPFWLIKLLDCSSVTTHSGQRSELNHIEFTTEKDSTASGGGAKGSSAHGSPAAFANGESGTKASFEMVLGPDGQTIDVIMKYSYRQPDAESYGKPFATQFSNSFTCRVDHPLLIHVASIPGQKNEYLAAILKVELVSYTGEKLEK
jgi:hypothetical protein